MKYGYATERQSEEWTAIGGDTREQAAVAAFDELYPIIGTCDRVYICERKPPTAEDLLLAVRPTADDVLERAEDDRELAPWYEDPLFDDGLTSRVVLQAELDEAIRRWLAKFPPHEVWSAENVTEHRREVHGAV